ANLTKMGEPCQQALLEELSDIAPAAWMEHMLPEPVVPSVQAPMPKTSASISSTAEADEKVLVRTFGGFRLSKGQVELAEDDWPTQKALRLFAHLAISRTPVTDGAMMEMLWPDAPEAKARNSLR